MAHVLRITDGTTTVTFTTSPIKLTNYNPSVSETGAPLTETVSVMFYSTTQSTNVANIRAVENLLIQAQNYEYNQTGVKIYAEFDPGTSGTVYRSQIHSGKIEPADRMLGIEYYNNTFLPYTVTWTRDPFWEGPLTQIPLSNTSDTSNTSGLAVNNASDSTHENFVDILAADVVGDLPAAIKVQIYNNTSGSAKNKEIYIFHNVYSNPSSFTHILEGEDATGSTLTDSVDANCSNGNKTTAAWTSTSETLIATWTITDAQSTYAAGGRFAALARWKGAFPYTNAWIRLKILTSNDKVLYSGNLSLVSTTRELAVLADGLRLPPSLAGQANLKGFKINMYGLRNAAGTHSIVLDYMQLSPISGNGAWKRFYSQDDGIAYQEYLIHDAVEGFDYRLDTGSKEIPEFTATGNPILLIPNKAQRLYFNECDKDGLAAISQQWLVKLWYRPRRSSL